MSCDLMTIIRLRTNCHMTISSHVTITICLLMQETVASVVPFAAISQQQGKEPSTCVGT